MRVQQVTAPLGGVSWTVIGSDFRQVDPVERYLAWLSAIERSPNTVRAYALDLKTFWVFLEAHGIRWDPINLEHRPPDLTAPQVHKHIAESSSPYSKE
jgi:integrase/recombinase XerD